MLLDHLSKTCALFSNTSFTKVFEIRTYPKIISYSIKKYVFRDSVYPVEMDFIDIAFINHSDTFFMLGRWAKSWDCSCQRMIHFNKNFEMFFSCVHFCFYLSFYCKKQFHGAAKIIFHGTRWDSFCKQRLNPRVCISMWVSVFVWNFVPIFFVRNEIVWMRQKPSDFFVFDRFSAGLCFTIVYAALFTKTNCIARVFKASKKTAKRPSFISPRSQIIICFVLIAIQVRTPWFSKIDVMCLPWCMIYFEGVQTRVIACTVAA